MKIVVIGGTGLIGTKVVKNLGDKGHEVVAASDWSVASRITALFHSKPPFVALLHSFCT
jgi:nucleoside-diphosphate-sugar epimerase